MCVYIILIEGESGASDMYRFSPICTCDGFLVL